MGVICDPAGVKPVDELLCLVPDDPVAQPASRLYMQLMRQQDALGSRVIQAVTVI